MSNLRRFMESGSEATIEEEWREVLASVRDAMRTSGRDPDLTAAAGLLLQHLAGFHARTGSAKLAARSVVQFVE